LEWEWGKAVCWNEMMLAPRVFVRSTRAMISNKVEKGVDNGNSNSINFLDNRNRFGQLALFED